MLVPLALGCDHRPAPTAAVGWLPPCGHWRPRVEPVTADPKQTCRLGNRGVPSCFGSIQSKFQRKGLTFVLSTSTIQKFDPARANEYQAQSRIALAGYDACHELSACMLSATIGGDNQAHILIVGAGGGAQEIVTASVLGPKWYFTAVDPSKPMMDIAVARLAEKGLAGRTEFHLGYVDDLPTDHQFDAATLFGVLHHQPGVRAKRRLLDAIASRLAPGAPLILAGNRYAYASQPLLLNAWGERWRMQGATADEVQSRLGKILEGADPPASEDALSKLLDEAGFTLPTWFFSSLFWGACLSRRTDCQSHEHQQLVAVP